MKTRSNLTFIITLVGWMSIVLAASGFAFPCAASTGDGSGPGSAGRLINQGIESPFIKVVEAVRDSVVYISGVHEVELKMPQYHRSRKYKGPGVGSGFIFRSDGDKKYIITNNHVIETAKTIEVTLLDKTRYRARVVGSDPKSDLAVIYIETDRSVKLALLGDSDRVKVGAWALAIGSPLPGLSRSDKRHLVNMHDWTLTVGVVSAKGRSHVNFGYNKKSPVFQDYIQTDASINPGNSGGPLFDIHGRVIGVNTAMVTAKGLSANIGIGYAIPANLTKKIANDLIDHGRVIRAYLGISPQDIDEDLLEALNLKSSGGVLVARVTDDTPAGKAGLEKGDVIIEFDGKKVVGLNKFRMIVANAEIGKAIELVVLRDGEEKTLTAELAEASEKELVSPINVPVSTHWLGVKVKKKGNKGLVVVGIEEYSPAYRSKLAKGDVILEVNDEVVKDWDDYKKKAKELKDERHITFYVKRGKKNLYVGLRNE